MGLLKLQVVRVSVAALLVASTVALAANSGSRSGPEAADAEVVIAATTTSSSSTTTTATTLPPTTTTVAPTTAPPPPRPVTTRRPVATTAARRPAVNAVPKPLPTGALAEYRGLGAWIDVFDWSNAYTNNQPGVGAAEVNRMADLGVQTLYVQAARHDSPSDVQEPERLLPIINQAHARGMRVIVWYLPSLEDVNRDLQRLLAISRLPVESVAVDIESRAVADAAERSRRLIDLSHRLRAALPGRSIGAIVLPPVVTDVINKNYWPGFPWHEIIPDYDAWMTMGYWTSRTQASGYRDAYRYTAENIDRLRSNLGLPAAPVHPIGGIGDKTTVADVEAFHRAATERGVLGGSLYDYRTTHDALWAPLQRFR
ncbi:MAG: hypothetical protein QOG87_3729 [Actinomycetota bacterium]